MSQKYAHLDAEGFVLGFYTDEFHSADQIPADAVPIDDDHHAALLEGQSAGKRMKVVDGLPALVDRVYTRDELAAALRSQRNAALSATDWIACRHMDEQMLGQPTTLTKEQAAALGAYRKALRDLPASKGFPKVALPVAPDFIGVK